MSTCVKSPDRLSCECVLVRNFAPNNVGHPGERDRHSDPLTFIASRRAFIARRVKLRANHLAPLLPLGRPQPPAQQPAPNAPPHAHTPETRVQCPQTRPSSPSPGPRRVLIVTILCYGTNKIFFLHLYVFMANKPRIYREHDQHAVSRLRLYRHSRTAQEIHSRYVQDTMYLNPQIYMTHKIHSQYMSDT